MTKQPQNLQISKQKPIKIDLAIQSYDSWHPGNTASTVFASLYSSFNHAEYNFKKIMTKNHQNRKMHEKYFLLELDTLSEHLSILNLVINKSNVHVGKQTEILSISQEQKNEANKIYKEFTQMNFKLNKLLDTYRDGIIAHNKPPSNMNEWNEKIKLWQELDYKKFIELFNKIKEYLIYTSTLDIFEYFYYTNKERTLVALKTIGIVKNVIKISKTHENYEIEYASKEMKEQLLKIGLDLSDPKYYINKKINKRNEK